MLAASWGDEANGPSAGRRPLNRHTARSPRSTVFLDSFLSPNSRSDSVLFYFTKKSEKQLAPR